MTSFKPGPDTALDFRNALACFATGVTVITTRTDIGPVGITANSFSSVSLDPPLVLWSPAKSSKRHDAFVRAGHFAIHVLGHEQSDVGHAFVRDGNAFNRFDTVVGEAGVPLIEGCLVRFECTQYAAHDAGDHTVVIGEVTRAVTRPGEPLLFVRSQYGRFTGAD